MSEVLMNTYGKPEIAFVKGEGCWLMTADEERYLDALSGIAVCSLGHAHPAVSQAISEQSTKLIHTSNLYQIPLQQQLAELLIEVSGMDKVFFSNSGAEANEAAIKLSRLHGRKKGFQSPKVIVANGSFHGRTMATLTATGNSRVHEGFEPLVEGFIRVPYNDVEAIEKQVEKNQDISAILLEPVQGEGGINIPDKGYLKRVRQICDEHDLLMMLDEVQCGMCRTGEWFAFEHEKIKPDVINLAKALGNGVPIGACLARGEAANLFKPGNHGSTFGGNPLAASAAIATIHTMQEIKADERAREMGDYLLNSFNQRLSPYEEIVQIRGIGMMIGIELDQPCIELVSKSLQNHLLINVTAKKVIRLLPPLILNQDEADELIARLAKTITTYLDDKKTRVQ